MNIDKYIASGILEEYVLGTLSASTEKEVKELAEKHPKIKSEITQIEDALEIYANRFSIKPRKNLNDAILGEIEKTVGFDLIPEVLSKDSEIEAYRYWLNKFIVPEFEEMHMEVIAESKAETMVIAWVKNGEQKHIHTEYTERFLIVEGSCTAEIGGVPGVFGVGDYIEFPKHIEHSYIVTSDAPMQVVACMEY